jgi:hypothetical protein
MLIHHSSSIFYPLLLILSPLMLLFLHQFLHLLRLLLLFLHLLRLLLLWVPLSGICPQLGVLGYLL